MNNIPAARSVDKLGHHGINLSLRLSLGSLQQLEMILLRHVRGEDAKCGQVYFSFSQDLEDPRQTMRATGRLDSPVSRVLGVPKFLSAVVEEAGIPGIRIQLPIIEFGQMNQDIEQRLAFYLSQRFYASSEFIVIERTASSHRIPD
jgi:hypothetical protein